MPAEPLAAHSFAEAYLYLMATPCSSCGKGTLKGSDARTVAEIGGEATIAIDTTCSACRRTRTFTFKLAESPSDDSEHIPGAISSVDEPSRIVDVGQWILLFRMITESAGRQTDKAEVRHLGLEAAQCLEEALKFYDDPENDLPPSEAFFTEASRERLKTHPEQFSKRRLIELRSKLPSLAAMRSCLSRAGERPWWRRWW